MKPILIRPSKSVSRFCSVLCALSCVAVIGCGKGAALKKAEQDRRQAEAQVLEAERKAEAQQAMAEKAVAETRRAEASAAREKAEAEKAVADLHAAEKLAADAKLQLEKLETEKRSGQKNPKGGVSTQRFPVYVTAYDIMTPEDEFYHHHLDSMCRGADLAQWPLVKALIGLGQDLIDAQFIATLVNETIHISDQPRAAPIVEMVNQCAELLQVQPPAVHIDGDHNPNAYVAGLREPHTLVLTSGLLELYEENPDELRFVIGHELGHIKANHIKTHLVGRSLVQAVTGERGAKATFKENFVATLAVGALLHWFRESEYSADRAGLICVGGDIRVAKQALLRLLHQTKPSNKLFDPSHPDFDAQLVLKNQMRLRDEPFVRIVSYLRQGKQSHPFIPERCAHLGMWSLSAEYLTILERSAKKPFTGTLVITEIAVKNIPKVDTYVPFVDSGAADPLVTISHAGESGKTEHKVDLTDATWSNPNLRFAFAEGAGVIMELLDYNATLGNKLIGSCLLPVSADGSAGKLTAEIRLDVLTTSTLIDRPTVTIGYKVVKE